MAPTGLRTILTADAPKATGRERLASSQPPSQQHRFLPPSCRNRPNVFNSILFAAHPSFTFEELVCRFRNYDIFLSLPLHTPLNTCVDAASKASSVPAVTIRRIFHSHGVNKHLTSLRGETKHMRIEDIIVFLFFY